MIVFLRTWMLGIVLTSFAVSLAGQIVPRGRERSMVRLVGGLLIMLALIRPLGELPWSDLSVPAGSFREQLQQKNEENSARRKNELAAIIAEKTETYIWDKATELGMECGVSVGIAVSQSGVPLPDTVTIDTAYHPVLAAWLEEVVGIPAEKQIWQEGSVWTETKEKGKNS